MKLVFGLACDGPTWPDFPDDGEGVFGSAAVGPNGLMDAVAVPTAIAQTEGGNNADSVQNDIVITATKRSERLRDVPLPVQAVTSETLEKLGARDFTDYARTVAGLQFVDSGTGRNQVFMRGVAAPQGYIGMQSAIGIYLDEVPISEGGSQPDLNLDDVDRVEVLRGPQGTLYGGASLSGTIRVITNKPDPASGSGFVEGDLSSTRSGNVNGSYTATVNVPLVRDAVAVRGVFYGRNMSGFIDNPATGGKDVNDENTYGGRLALRALPTDGLTVDLTVTH